LWSNLPKDQIEAVMATDAACEIGPDFLGFVDIYRNLAEIIPTHYTVVDLGCAYAPQSWYFRAHKKYIGVDLCVTERFAQGNSEHFKGTIRQFINDGLPLLDLDTSFGICSYVPPWHDDNAALVRAAFRHCFVYYPCGLRPHLLGGGK
jgi:hypothetical protein